MKLLVRLLLPSATNGPLGVIDAAKAAPASAIVVTTAIENFPNNFMTFSPIGLLFSLSFNTRTQGPHVY